MMLDVRRRAAGPGADPSCRSSGLADRRRPPRRCDPGPAAAAPARARVAASQRLASRKQRSACVRAARAAGAARRAGSRRSPAAGCPPSSGRRAVGLVAASGHEPWSCMRWARCTRQSRGTASAPAGRGTTGPAPTSTAGPGAGRTTSSHARSRRSRGCRSPRTDTSPAVTATIASSSLTHRRPVPRPARSAPPLTQGAERARSGSPYRRPISATSADSGQGRLHLAVPQPSVGLGHQQHPAFRIRSVLHTPRAAPRPGRTRRWSARTHRGAAAGSPARPRAARPVRGWPSASQAR